VIKRYITGVSTFLVQSRFWLCTT